MVRKCFEYDCTTTIDDYGEEWCEFNTITVHFNESWGLMLLGYPGGIKNGCFVLKQAKLTAYYEEDIPAFMYYKPYLDKRKKPTINIKLKDIANIELFQGDINVDNDNEYKYKIPSKYVVVNGGEFRIKPEQTIYITTT